MSQGEEEVLMWMQQSHTELQDIQDLLEEGGKSAENLTGLNLKTAKFVTPSPPKKYRWGIGRTKCTPQQ